MRHRRWLQPVVCLVLREPLTVGADPRVAAPRGGAHRRYAVAGPVLLRAAVLAFSAHDQGWPDLDDVEDCRRWLRVISEQPWFSGLREASPRLAVAVDRAASAEPMAHRRVVRASVSTARYLLRAAGRPTPFGLFAGVAVASLGPTSATIGTEHRVAARPDNLWLDHVRRDLESRRDVIRGLRFQCSDLAVRRGDVLIVQQPGGAVARTTVSRPLATLLAVTAGTPASYDDIYAELVELGGSEPQIDRLLRQSIAAGVLTSSLAAPMTCEDPLGYLIEQAGRHPARLADRTAALLESLGRVHRLLGDHEQAPSSAVRSTVAMAMTELPIDSRATAGATASATVSADVVLEATVRVPAQVVAEASRAADALVALTRHQGPTPAWATYQSQFWERYGTDCLVPLREVIDSAAGLGLPPGYPGTTLPGEGSTAPATIALPRDRELARLAWAAVTAGRSEIVLDDAAIARLRSAKDSGGDGATPVAPHVDLAFRLWAGSAAEVDRGDFTLGVRPAWSAGVLTGRFASVLPDSGPSDSGLSDGGLSDVFAALPTLVEGALTAQLSFVPIFPHAQNVARARPRLPLVVSIGEHRQPAENVIGLDDLAVVATGTRLHLVSISRRRVVEPVVLHPLALDKQAPPIARFVAMLGRGYATAWTAFDWGPLVGSLPFLPRVRYRRAILSPARWRLDHNDLTGDRPTAASAELWGPALQQWRAQWRCPRRVEVYDEDRTLRLDLDEPLHRHLLQAQMRRHGSVELTETVETSDVGWIGHAHEFTASFASTARPLPHPRLADAPIVTNRHLPIPAEPDQRWLQVKLFTAAADIDHLVLARLPALLADLPDHRSWFVRYRSLTEQDHLRLRVSAGPTPVSNVIERLARWAGTLRADSVISAVVIDAYRPEFGRYGDTAALHAAESVFVADSTAVRLALHNLHDTDRRVVCALGMIAISRGLLGDRDGIDALARTPVHGPGLRAVTEETTRETRRRAHRADEYDHPAATAEAEAERRTRLRRYRTLLPDDRLDTVLDSLLHMHHNRMIGLDRATERYCRHAARQAARSLRATSTP